jgi:N6-L-threonylcarbamoyladenine synthase
MGQTRDDAAGEAYDKVAKLLALGYPGGPVIDQLAKHAPATNGGSIQFAPAKMKGNSLDFSFSGIKTAVLYYVRAHPELLPEIQARQAALERGERGAGQLLALCSGHTLELVREFQNSIVNSLVLNASRAAAQCQAASVLVSGGVAANSQLRQKFAEASRKSSGGPPAGCPGVDVFFPSPALSTDNAAMIAAAAYPKLLAGELADSTLDAQATLPLA